MGSSSNWADHLRKCDAPTRSAGDNASESKPAGTILVVEDDLITLEVIKATLEERVYVVTTAFDCAQALAGNAWLGADLVVTDIDMPRMGGIYMMRIMRSRRPLLPIVIVTGFADRIPLTDLQAEAPGPLLMQAKPASGAQVADLVDALLAGVRRQQSLSAPQPHPDVR